MGTAGVRKEQAGGGAGRREGGGSVRLPFPARVKTPGLGPASVACARDLAYFLCLHELMAHI